MKLSDVTRAHVLQQKRRELVIWFVEIGQGKGDVAHWSSDYFLGKKLDPDMEKAVRSAAGAEINRRVGLIDAELAGFGIEVDGIEIAIKEEEARQAKLQEAEDGRREALSEDAA